MNLNYDKIKSKMEQGGHQWTSYSDLFLVLSVTFLLLFVAANLRSGTASVAASQELRAAREEVENLRKQIKAYEVLKDDYLAKGASKDEIAVYQELMDKLDLLESQANEEHRKAAQQAKDARERHLNLNRYQQLVKNIVNANLVASSKVQKRDEIIDAQGKELSQLDREVAERRAEIERNNVQIASIESDLETQKANLKAAFAANQKTKERYEAELQELEQSTSQKIVSLRQTNQQAQRELDSTRARLDEKSREAETLVATLSSKEQEFRSSIANLTSDHERTLAQQKAAYEQSLNNARLSAKAKKEQARRYAEELERERKAYGERMARLNADLQNTQGALADAGRKYQDSLQSLQKTNDTLQRDLKASVEKLNAQRKLAEQIKANLARSGVQANVDPKTGDVTIEFHPDYFDTDKATLKPTMRQTLAQAIPAYAKSLFEDPQVVKRLGSVEIVGFASPTFAGKVVDPASLETGDRLAVNYNMDLSYKRAKTIFEYMFDPNKLTFPHQKDMLPYVKVSGRSYLSSEPLRGPDRAIAGTRNDYCAKFDCKKSQIVIIKFNLKEE